MPAPDVIAQPRAADRPPVAAAPASGAAPSTGATVKAEAQAAGTPAGPSNMGPALSHSVGACSVGSSASLPKGATGTRAIPYQVSVCEESSCGTMVNAYFTTISAMPQYEKKSLEELR